MDKTAIIKILARFHKEIEARGIRPLKVILYGSYASDSNREGSDIDIVVISDDFKYKSYWERIIKMKVRSRWSQDVSLF